MSNFEAKSSIEQGNVYRSHPTRISDLGEVSPNRKSVEELKKQLQSQVLKAAANLSCK